MAETHTERETAMNTQIPANEVKVGDWIKPRANSREFVEVTSTYEFGKGKVSITFVEPGPCTYLGSVARKKTAPITVRR